MDIFSWDRKISDTETMADLISLVLIKTIERCLQIRFFTSVQVYHFEFEMSGAFDPRILMRIMQYFEYCIKFHVMLIQGA